MGNIHFHFESIDKFSINRKNLKNWIIFTLKKEKKFLDQISIIFCNDEYLLEINNRYLNHNYYTDIITFDYSEGNTISGDLYISIDMIKYNSNLYSVEIDEEFYRVIIHGILHLCGYKDKSSTEKENMTEKENSYLSNRINIF